MADEQAAKEKQRVRMKAWREANKERIAAYQKDWRQRNATEIAEYQQAYHAEYRAKDDVQFKMWMRNLERNYKITPGCFNRLWDEQSGMCAVCGVLMRPRGRDKNSACVDHNHATGEVRGLLCRACNHGIGNLKDDPEVLRKAAEYLDKRGHYAHLKGNHEQ